MAVRKPVVLVTGGLAELPSSDTLDIPASAASFTPTLVTSTFTVPADSQAVMGRPIVVSAGGSIVVNANSVLLNVV